MTARRIRPCARCGAPLARRVDDAGVSACRACFPAGRPKRGRPDGTGHILPGISIVEVAAMLGLTRAGIYARLRRGWDVRVALTRASQRRRTT